TSLTTPPSTASPITQTSKSTELPHAVHIESTEMPPTTADLPATLSQGDVGTTDNLSTEIEEKRGVEKKEKMVTAAIGIEVQEQMEVEKKEIDEREKMKVAATEIKIQEPMEVDEKEIDEKKQTGVATTEIEIKGEMVVEERDIEKKEKKEGVK